MSASSDRWAEYKAQVEARLDYRKIFSEIQGAKPSGNGHLVGLCPFHKDSNPSFGYDTKTGAWECFSGCGKGSAFDYLMQRSSRGFKEVLVELGEGLGLPPPSDNGDGTGQVVYSYRDEAGTELFQVVRAPGKKFWQRRPNGSGGYINGLRDVRRVLYRLPELLAHPNDTVFVVEGEKDVERLRLEGLLATTNPGGAGKWRQEYGSHLAGRDVAILPDNDEPGRRHAEQMARSLQDVAATIKIVELPDLPDKGDVTDWLAARHTAADLQSLIGGADVWQPPAQPRPQIMVSDRQFVDLIGETWRVLLAANDPPQLFISAGQLARLVNGEGPPRIQYLEESSGYGILARTADWTARRGRSIVDARPPKDVSRDIVVNPHPDLPVLDGILGTPVFLPSGQLLREPGYHPDARFWLHLDEQLATLEVPEHPTDQDVTDAVDLLCGELLVDFPFKAESDQAHALAALILPFVRRMFLGPTPIHLIEAPTPGSGKGLFADLVSLIALGRPCESTTITRSEDECRKKLTAILSRGHPVVALDNIQGGVDSAQIASAITAEIWSDRVLGKTQMVDFPNRAVWMMTANNPKLSMEIARRCVRIRLEPPEEHPWERTGFKHHPLRDWARDHRRDLVQAILTIVQSWLTAGRPVGSRTLGSFESWAQTLGGILRNAGIKEFLQDTDEFYAEADPDSGEWATFVEVWWEKYETRPVGVRDLLTLADEHDLVGFAYAAKTEAGQRQRFGRALTGLRGRRFGDLEVTVGSNSDRKVNAYRVRAVTSDLFDDKEPF
ncbi:MAG TPA: CHC2 zinc finger domain-containing protein [Candidatus Krumholzibacteria bacterium]|nr:CHC2 zinc finger domain-containing protein [Candidatus Krumholzibacteria bacterium]HPD73311.1 CHC2 zinc finger domain-containing protein [Candidatus Krumholzibacteria bacterium]HRY42027.1 CHC2 zinc finger domain-containing protein [Candidatus Krumholzibacteria bacterium]